MKELGKILKERDEADNDIPAMCEMYSRTRKGDYLVGAVSTPYTSNEESRLQIGLAGSQS
jgi:hypothetical protein